MDTILDSPAARIRFIAKKFHKNVKGLAHALGLQASSMYSYLDTKSGAARSIPGKDMLERFHRAGYNIEWILYGVGDIKSTGEDFASVQLSDIPQMRKKQEYDEYTVYEIIVPKTSNQRFLLSASTM